MAQKCQACGGGSTGTLLGPLVCCYTCGAVTSTAGDIADVPTTPQDTPPLSISRPEDE